MVPSAEASATFNEVTDLYRRIDDRDRHPVFLRRNLTRALDHHANQLGRGAPPDPDGRADRPASRNGACESDGGCVSGPYHLEQAELDDLVNRSSAMLQVDIRSLRVDDPSHLDDEERPRKRKRLSTVHCDVEVAVVRRTPSHHASQKRSNIYRQSRPATLEPRQRKDGALFFDIDMGEPILIKVEQLPLLPKVRSQWARAFSTSGYDMCFNFHLSSIEDASLLFPHSAKSKSSTHDPLGTMVSSNWSQLPDCPPNGRVLTVTPNWHGKKDRKGHKLDVGISWSEADTILEVQNRRRLVCQSSALARSQVRERSLHITYVLKHQVPVKTYRYSKPRCCICRARNYHTFDKLRWHLTNSHELLTFDINIDRSSSGRGIKALIQVGLSEQSITNIDSVWDDDWDELLDIAWAAPARPFDLSAWTKGDQSWTSGEPAEPAEPTKGSRWGGAGPSKDITTTSSSDHPPKNFHQRRSEDRPPPKERIEDTKPPPRLLSQRRVEDRKSVPKMTTHLRSDDTKRLLPVEREKHRVPAPPEHVSFFRTLSKREIAEGDLLSESDDDVQDDWLRTKQNSGVAPLSTSSATLQKAEVALMQARNDYGQHEQLTGDLYAGDALMRFVKREREGLFTRSAARASFSKLATELRQDSIISPATLDRAAEEMAHAARLSKRNRLKSRGPKTLEESLASIGRSHPRPAKFLTKLLHDYSLRLRDDPSSRATFLRRLEQLKRDQVIDDESFKRCLKMLQSNSTGSSTASRARSSLSRPEDEMDSFANRLQNVQLVSSSHDSDKEVVLFLLNLQDDPNPEARLKQMADEPEPPEPANGSVRPSRQKWRRLEWNLDRTLAQLGLAKYDQDHFKSRLAAIERYVTRLILLASRPVTPAA